MTDARTDIRLNDQEATAPLTFKQVGALISRVELWGAWIAQEPERGELFRDAYNCVVRLKSHTGWSDDEMLENLGCETKADDELKLTKEKLENCLSYMLWVETLLTPHDLALDKRVIVRGAARFFVLADRNLDLVKRIMDGGSEFSPSKYLALGEVAQAWRCATRQLDGEAGERARALNAMNPFVDESTPHMSPKRLEMLAKENANQLLGTRVAARMREHLELCHVCAHGSGLEVAPGRSPMTQPLATA
jgi:hypothetical protein